MGVGSLLLKDKSFFSLENDDHKAIRNVFDEAGACGLVKMTVDPSTCTSKQLEDILRGKDAVVSYHNELYYIKHNTFNVTKIDVTDLNHDDVSQLLNKFANNYKLANFDELQLIMAVTGDLPLRGNISADTTTFLLDQKELFENRLYLPALLENEIAKLNAINAARFIFMNKAEREELKRKLLFIFSILYAQFQLDVTEQRLQNINAQTQQLLDCAKLIYKLRQTPPIGKTKSPEQLHQEIIDDSDMPVKYLGLTVVAPFIVEKMDEFSSGKTTVFKKWMGEVNGRRLYWVWGSSLLRTIIERLPDELKTQPTKAVNAPAKLCGYMSWVLYYTRFGVELGLLLKHVIAGPWMHAEERAIPAWQRFKAQWRQRKFALLNDSIWGTANLACFWWLKGTAALQLAGDALTGALLLMDCCVAAWQFCEARTQHKMEMDKFDTQADELHKKIIALRAKKDKDEKDTEYLAYLIKQLDHLLNEKNQYAFNWQYKKYNFINNLVYAVGLLSSFNMMCCFFFPPGAMAAGTATILGIVGAALCFVLTVAYSAISSGIDVAKARQSGKSTKEELTERLQAYKELKREKFDSEEAYIATKKQLYLDLKQLVASTIYQERSANFQKLHLVRKIITDALIPPLILGAFVFFPMGIGIAAVAAGLILAYAINTIVNKFEPKADKLPVMDMEEEERFLSFQQDPTLEKLLDKKDLSNGEKKLFSVQTEGVGNKFSFSDEMHSDVLILATGV